MALNGIMARRSILDVWQDCEYFYALQLSKIVSVVNQSFVFAAQLEGWMTM